jgi:hypothetical protein
MLEPLPPRLGPLRQRMELSFAAFVPAFALFAVRTYGTGWFWLFLSLAATGVVFLGVLALLVRSGNPEPFEIEAVVDKGDDVLGHVGAYLLPVVLDPSGGTRQMVVSVLVLALIVQIHVSTGRVHVNPLLYVVGRRVHSAVSGGQTYYVVSRTDPASWVRKRPLFVSVGSSLLVERGTQ